MDLALPNEWNIRVTRAAVGGRSTIHYEEWFHPYDPTLKKLLKKHGLDLRTLVDNTQKTVAHILGQMPDVFEFETKLLSTTILLCNAKDEPQKLRRRSLPMKYGISLSATATTARVATFLTGEFINHSLLAEYKLMDLFRGEIGARMHAAMTEMGRI